MKIINAVIVLLTLAVSGQATAHHSYAVYDIDNKIERTGVLTRFYFTQPHIELELMVENADGSIELWSIESTSPQRWERKGLPRTIAEIGETVTLEGWPARNGVNEMLLSSITTAEQGRVVITDEVKQRRARQNIPAVTVKRD